MIDVVVSPVIRSFVAIPHSPGVGKTYLSGIFFASLTSLGGGGGGGVVIDDGVGKQTWFVSGRCLQYTIYSYVGR